MNKISVLGCGSWGSALAQSLSKNSHSIVMWHYNTDKLINFKKTRIHPNLKNFKFNSKIKFLPSRPGERYASALSTMTFNNRND